MNNGWRDSIFALIGAAVFTAIGYGAVELGLRMGNLIGSPTSFDFREFLFFASIGAALALYVHLADGAVKAPLAISRLKFDRIALAFALATLAYQAVEIAIYLIVTTGKPSDLKQGLDSYRVLGAVNAVIMAPLIEEALFRGFVYTRIEKAAGPAWAIMLSALAFGVFHGENGIGYVLAMVPAGVFFGYMRLKSGSIALSIASHAWMNATVGLLAYLI